MGIFGKLKESLAKVGGGMLAGVFAGPERIDEDFYEELEEALIVADVGMETTEILLARLRQGGEGTGTAYPERGPAGYGGDLGQGHGSPKPPLQGRQGRRCC